MAKNGKRGWIQGPMNKLLSGGMGSALGEGSGEGKVLDLKDGRIK